MPAPIPLERAAAASAVYERLGNQTATAEFLGMPRRTVGDIVNGYGRWCELATDSSFVALRHEQKRLFQAAIPSILGKALVNIEKKIVDASLGQSVYAFGVLSDKLALLNGESTNNVAIHGSISNLDDLANALRGELVKRSSNRP